MDTIVTLKPGNCAELLPSGKDSYKRRWELLNNAKHTIHIVTFSMMKDNTSRKLVDLLIAKRKEGVEVKIILDDIVNRTTFVGNFIAELEENGVQVHRYNYYANGWRINWSKGHPFKQLMRTAKLKLKQHFHEKYMVVDGSYVILGGINWGDKYAYGGIREEAWRDSDVYITGPVVHDIQLQFLKDFHRYKLWDHVRKGNPLLPYYEFVKTIKHIDNNYIESHYAGYLNKPSPGGNVNIGYVAHKPYDDEELRLTNIFLELIASAQERIYWGCHGIRPPRIFGEYFANAVKRGVEVILITNSRHSAKTLMVNGLLGWMYLECSKHYKYLLQNGIRIFEWQKKGAFHSKNFVVDDKLCSLGSFNIARGSSYHHSESNVFIDDKDFIKSAIAQFHIDLQSCKEVKLDQIIGSLPRIDAFKRILHERDLMIKKELIPNDMKIELSQGKYKNLLT